MAQSPFAYLAAGLAQGGGAGLVKLGSELRRTARQKDRQDFLTNMEGLRQENRLAANEQQANLRRETNRLGNVQAHELGTERDATKAGLSRETSKISDERNHGFRKSEIGMRGGIQASITKMAAKMRRENDTLNREATDENARKRLKIANEDRINQIITRDAALARRYETDKEYQSKLAKGIVTASDGTIYMWSADKKLTDTGKKTAPPKGAARVRDMAAWSNAALNVAEASGTFDPALYEAQMANGGYGNIKLPQSVHDASPAGEAKADEDREIAIQNIYDRENKERGGLNPFKYTPDTLRPEPSEGAILKEIRRMNAGGKKKKKLGPPGKSSLAPAIVPDKAFAFDGNGNRIQKVNGRWVPVQ